MMSTSQRKMSLSSINPAENPSTGFLFSSATTREKSCVNPADNDNQCKARGGLVRLLRDCLYSKLAAAAAPARITAGGNA